MLIVLVTLLAGCGGDPAEKAEVRLPEQTHDEVEADSGDRIVEEATPWGRAAIELVVESLSIGPGEKLSFHLLNRGNVELLTGLPYTVERWDGGTWEELPLPENTVWPMVGLLLRPTGETKPQSWPWDEPIAPGRYRIVKSATAESKQSSTQDITLVARAVFEVTG